MSALVKKFKDIYYYSGFSVFCQWLTKIFFLIPYFYWFKNTKIVFENKDALDPKAHYVVVSNHRSYEDPPLMGFALGRPVAFVAKKELFSNFFLALFMWATSTISVDRAAPDKSTFKEAKEAMKHHCFPFTPWNLGIFIEGTRSKDPEYLSKPNKGPIFIAKLAKAQILPMGISYEGKNVTVKIGEPYEVDPKADLDDQAWDCLEKISKLCVYKMPSK